MVPGELPVVREGIVVQKEGGVALGLGGAPKLEQFAGTPAKAKVVVPVVAPVGPDVTTVVLETESTVIVVVVPPCVMVNTCCGSLLGAGPVWAMSSIEALPST